MIVLLRLKISKNKILGTNIINNFLVSLSSFLKTLFKRIEILKSTIYLKGTLTLFISNRFNHSQQHLVHDI